MQRRAENPIRRFMRKEAVAGYLFVSPWVLGFALFYAYPLINTVYYSFTDYQLFGDPQWVGLQNYTKLLFHDPMFAQTGLAYVALCDTARPSSLLVEDWAWRFCSIVRFLATISFVWSFYLPSLMVGVAVSTMFTQVFPQQDYGLMNTCSAFSIFPLLPGWPTTIIRLWSYSRSSASISGLWAVLC